MQFTRIHVTKLCRLNVVPPNLEYDNFIIKHEVIKSFECANDPAGGEMPQTPLQSVQLDEPTPFA